MSILRHNPVRAAGTVKSHDHKLQSLEAMVAEDSLYLEEHPRAKGVEEAIHNLSTLCTVSIPINTGKPMNFQIPEPTPDLEAILDAAGVTLPIHIEYSGTTLVRSLPPLARERDRVPAAGKPE